MLVSIIIVNYNTYALTCQCVDSLIGLNSPLPFEILIVDNASPDEDPKAFTDKYGDKICLIQNPQNNGFAKGNNLGIVHAHGDIILLLNSDTWMLSDSVSLCARFLEVHPEAGVVSVPLLYTDKTYQGNARAFRSIGNELLDLFFPLLYLLPYRRRAKRMLNQYFRGDFDTSVDWTGGAFFMFRKSLLNYFPEQKLDERFFMYGEDQLWCLQAKDAGFVNYFLKDEPVIHIANASTEPEKIKKVRAAIIRNELEIMRYRYPTGVYYPIFRIIFITKEHARDWIKSFLNRFLKNKFK